MAEVDIATISSGIPEADLGRIVKAYEIVPHPELDLLAQEFVSAIEVQVHNEMYWDHPVKTDYLNWQIGPAIRRFLDRETHFALERAGHPWDDSSGKFTALAAEQYHGMRDRVAAAFVRYAIEFFSHPEQYVKYRSDGSNLRTSLDPWMT